MTFRPVVNMFCQIMIYLTYHILISFAKNHMQHINACEGRYCQSLPLYEVAGKFIFTIWVPTAKPYRIHNNVKIKRDCDKI